MIKVLDHGFVELVDQMGTDLTVVNSARVSFGKRVQALENRDEKLIKYLAEHKHWSPFRHCYLQFHIKQPEVVARQFYKHVVGVSYTNPHPTIDHAWNEISGRYVNAEEFDYYIPDTYRAQSADNKQASEGIIDDQDKANEIYNDLINHAKQAYSDLINLGVAKEQARAILPVSFYTEFYWSASLQAVANFVALRDKKDAQGEIQEYAKVIRQLAEEAFPVSFPLLVESMK